MIKIIIKITNRIYLIINSIPKKLIFNIFTINLEKFFCSIIFGNYSTMLLNINGQKILSKNLINVRKFYKKNHLEFFKTDLENLDFNPLKFINDIPDKHKRYYNSNDEISLIKKIFKGDERKKNQNFKFSIDLLKLKKENNNYISEINQLTNLLINNKSYKEINSQYFNIIP